MGYLDVYLRLMAGDASATAVYEIEEPLAHALGAMTRRVCVSWQTVYKQRKTHADIGAIDYLYLYEMMTDALALLERKPEPRLHLCYERCEGKRYVATIKATSDGLGMYVVRFHRARKRLTKSLMARCVKLRNHKLYKD